MQLFLSICTCATKITHFQLKLQNISALIFLKKHLINDNVEANFNQGAHITLYFLIIAPFLTNGLNPFMLKKEESTL